MQFQAFDQITGTSTPKEEEVYFPAHWMFSHPSCHQSGGFFPLPHNSSRKSLVTGIFSPALSQHVPSQSCVHSPADRARSQITAPQHLSITGIASCPLGSHTQERHSAWKAAGENALVPGGGTSSSEHPKAAESTSQLALCSPWEG